MKPLRLKTIVVIIILAAVAGYCFWALLKYPKDTTRNRIALRAPDGSTVVDSSGTRYILSDNNGAVAGDDTSPRHCVSNEALSVEDQEAGQIVAMYGSRLIKIPGVWVSRIIWSPTVIS